MVDPRFAPHNLHLDDPALFRTMDPQLRELQRLPIAYRYPILAHLPVDQPGVYSITGGRRVGKSTSSSSGWPTCCTRACSHSAFSI